MWLPDKKFGDAGVGQTRNLGLKVWEEQNIFRESRLLFYYIF